MTISVPQLERQPARATLAGGTPADRLFEYEYEYENEYLPTDYRSRALGL